MVVALRADFIVTLNFFAIDDFPAMVAFEPHPFRNLGSFRAFRLGRFLFFKPGHCALLNSPTQDRHHLASRLLENTASSVLASFGPSLGAASLNGLVEQRLRTAEYHSRPHHARRFPIDVGDGMDGQNS
jgi:hypothetical protein